MNYEPMLLPSMRAFEDLGKGMDVLILGNAKSLLDIPLDKIFIPTIAVNRIAMIFDRVKWRPSWYLCGTMRIGWNNDYADDFYSAVNSSKHSFLGTRIKHLVNTKKINQGYTWVDLLDIADVTEQEPRYEYWYRKTKEKEISIYGHTCFGAIQLARYAGFERIILGGMDLPYEIPESKEVDTNHFDSKYETGILQPKSEQYKVYNTNLHHSHQFTSLMAKKDEIKIYSLETNRGLDYYERIKIDELI